MEKAVRHITSLEEWKALTQDGARHKDMEAILEVTGQRVFIRQPVFFRVVLQGKTSAYIHVPAQSDMEIVLKGEANAVIQQGSVTAKGESSVILLGHSEAMLTNRAVCLAFGETRAELRQYSCGWFYEESAAKALENSTAYIGEYAESHAEAPACIYDLGTTGYMSYIARDAGEHVKKGGLRLRRKYAAERSCASAVIAQCEQALKR